MDEIILKLKRRRDKYMNKKIILSKTIILLSLVSLFSCTSSKQEFNLKPITCTNLNPVYITNSKKVYLLHPVYASYVVDTLQLLNGNYDSSNFSLLIYTQMDTKGINLSLMNEFGTDMGNLFFNGEKIFFESAYFPKELPGEYIICDIQNAFYDVEALRDNYANSKLRFNSIYFFYETYTPGQPDEIRSIYDGDTLIEEIEISYKTIKIKNYLRNYSYVLCSE